MTEAPEFRFGSKAEETFSVYLDLWDTTDPQTFKFSFKDGITNDDVENHLMSKVYDRARELQAQGWQEESSLQRARADILNGRVYHPNVLLRELTSRTTSLAARVDALEAAATAPTD